jgi:hypothetical protein
MSKKIWVGGRFFKIRIPEDELKRLKEGAPTHFDFDEILDTYEKYKQQGHNLFYENIEILKDMLTSHMKSKGLPYAPHLYRSGSSLRSWQPTPPEGWTQDDISQNRLSLDRFILHSGHIFDSPEHLAARGIYLIHLIELMKKGNSTFSKDVILPSLIFDLGHVFTLYSVYSQVHEDMKDISKKPRNIWTKSWEAYGRMLLEEYPNQKHEFIWGQIPLSERRDEEPLDEPNAPERIFIYRFSEGTGEKEKIIAKSDITGDMSKPLTFNSFRTLYLKKKSLQK